MDDYRDIINLPHRQSQKRQRMSLHDRAAQFAPFAALTGYDDAVRETERLTDRRPETSEDRAEMLDRRLRWLRDHPDRKPEITVKWFVPDIRKAGGAYRTRTCRAKRLDTQHSVLQLEDSECIPISEICDLQISQADV